MENALHALSNLILTNKPVQLKVQLSCFTHEETKAQRDQILAQGHTAEKWQRGTERGLTLSRAMDLIQGQF